jgi:hypothetical protein
LSTNTSLEMLLPPPVSAIGRRIAPEQELERAQRLGVRVVDLAQRVAVAVDVRAGDRDRLLVAVADPQAIGRDAMQLLGRAQQIVRDPALQAGLDGEEPRLGDRRGERLARVGEIGLRGRSLLARRGRAVAHAPPDVELERCVQEDAVDAAGVAARRAAPEAAHADRRQQRRARNLQIAVRLLDDGGGGAQVGVVDERLGDELGQLRIVERSEPAVDDELRRAALALPRRRQRDVLQRVPLQIRGVGRPLERAARRSQRERHAGDPSAGTAGAHQCSFSTR